MKKVNPKKLPDLYVIDGIRVINICDWLTAAYGEEFWDHRFDNPDYEQTGKELMAWCADNDSAYWAAPREDFSVHVAARFARVRGHKMVVVEDLS